MSDKAEEAMLPYNENIVKKAREILGVSNEELAKMIGYKYSAVNKASSGNVSNQMKRALEMLLKIHELEEQLEEYNNLKKLIKKAANS